MGVRRGLLSISRWLGSFPSIGYALIYLALIPGFAGIYYELPGEFYHSTLQHEGVTGETFESILQDLNSFIHRQSALTHTKHDFGTSLPAPADLEWRFYTFGVDNLQIIGNEVSFEIHTRWWRGNKPLREVSSEELRDLPTKISFNVLHTPESDDRVIIQSEPFGETLSIFPDRPSRLEFERELLPLSDLDDHYGTLDLTAPFLERMRRFGGGAKGVGSEIEGNFWRMFYLSAVTITTVGYGDIVPVTTATRLLVSLEAILGIVLIGLFLNSLAYERAEADEIYKREKEREAADKAHKRLQEMLVDPPGGKVVRDDDTSYLT